MIERPWYAVPDRLLIGATLALAICGVVLIRSAVLHDPTAANEWQKQIAYVVVGIAVCAVFAVVDYRRWRRWALGLYVLNLGMLMAVMRGGHSALGAQRWISLGPLGTFQPSEPAKLILAITTAALLARAREVGLREFALAAAALAPPALLILKQPDLGTMLVLVAVLSAELLFASRRLIDVALYGAIGAIGAAAVVGTNVVLKPFQRARLLVFLHPDVDPQGVGWNLAQSKIAVGSGELFGKGLFRGTQTQLRFVPENSRDFIFTVLGEEFGFVGAIALLLAYAIMLGCAVRAAATAPDRFGAYLCIGVVAMLAFHIVVNVGMTIGVMPITGIPLPFLSYGGSAVLTDFAAVGILLNVRRESLRAEF